MDQIVEKLATIPLLRNLTVDQLRHLTRACECIFVAPGKTLVAQGEVAEAAYLCLDDTVLRECITGERDQPDVTSVPAESVIMELAMVVETEAAAGFVAEGHARVLQISRPKLLALLEEDPELARVMGETLSERLHEIARSMREAIESFENVPSDTADDKAQEASADAVSVDVGEEERRSA